MAEIRAFSIEEQLEFLDDLVSVFEVIAEAVDGENTETLQRAKLDLAKIQAVRETIHLEYQTERWVTEGIQWNEKSPVC